MQLATHFEVKKLGTLKYFLGIEIAQSSDGYLMMQQKYILDLLNVINFLQSKVKNTLVESNHELTFSEEG